DYSDLLRAIVKKFSSQVVLDLITLQKFPDYEDKLFQVNFMKNLQIPTPITYSINNISNLDSLKFPKIMKKRYSSRNKGNFIVNHINEVQNILKNNNNIISDYIFQEIINFQEDYRVMILNDSYLGAVKRNILKDKDKYKVKISDEIAYLPDKIKENCIFAAKSLGADLLGVDILKDIHGNYFFIE